ncbi:MAG: type II toxin-antitoxin system RelE/ParE family toxin [Gammaproteobacteria bacterium]
MGRHVPEAERQDVRELLYKDYRIIYRIKPEQVDILTVIHGSRDLKRLKTKPWNSTQQSPAVPGFLFWVFNSSLVIYFIQQIGVSLAFPVIKAYPHL